MSRLAVVVQRYGADINGGAELHARYIAERLASRFDVRVLTTCARDYVSWRNDFPPGADTVHGIQVERFPVARERNLPDFGIKTRRVFVRAHTLQEELDWLESQGPVSPGLLSRLRRSRDEFEFVILFSVRYHQTYYGARAVSDRAVLVPTAEREPALGLSMFQPVFRGVRAIMYNSPEERAAIHALSHNESVPGVVVGVGSAIPATVDAAKARKTFGLNGPFLLYVGRIDENKGCAELFDFYLRYLQTAPRPVDLVLVGTAAMPIPDHPRIRHLGYVADQDKFDVLAAAEALVMPSAYESLSMVTLEAWALGRPVLANARCDVLVGQCRRSGGGFCYAHFGDFETMLDRLLADPSVSADLGRRGRQYYDAQYSWSVIEDKYLTMFDRLRSEPRATAMERLPGWFARRRPDRPAAIDVVAGLPSGAAPEAAA